ncbi:hypothetical protein GCK72_008488 [Caenorhabditis remanei]|uniref:Uncharacterized protein n=1 Tax=Caenorhabditis remanei TaxID=31234 RepID=A0A6A5H1A3_CAERE|nr:hypothetical protein GCK72_008488 [Caenorhabditis remanei]KAF1760242.1 hypothetical protein GCK72_008488 [Caenorhabditis remanei]
MNQKATMTSITPPAAQAGANNGKILHRIEDIAYSDADTFPEFSNRDGSKETTTNDKHWQLIMIRVPENPNDTHIKTINDAITNEMRATWKTPPTSFVYVAAPHISILNLAHGVAKKHFGEKTALRSSFFFSEPKNDKFMIARDSELRNLKYEVILGAARFSWNKLETRGDMEKRIESTLFELMRVLPNLVLFLGPIVFDTLYEILEKQKRKSINTVKPGVIVENFKRENNKWKRVQKHGATSISVPLC